MKKTAAGATPFGSVIQRFFYQCLVFFSSLFGNGFFLLIARTVACGYFLIFPGRVKTGMAFYKAVFPDKSRWHHLYCVWRQYQNFTTLFLDRLQVVQNKPLNYESDGWHYLEQALGRKTGGIMLMSHIGNWEIAAHLLKKMQPDLPLMLFLGKRHKEAIETFQKQDLARSGIRILSVEKDSGSPLDILDAVRFLKSGGLVSMTGDRLWHDHQRYINVPFFNACAHLPETPHVLALVSGSPLFFFFTFKTGGRYRFTISPPVFVAAGQKADKSRAVAESARCYAEALEQAVLAHPFEWYHFAPFLRT